MLTEQCKSFIAEGNVHDAIVLLNRHADEQQTMMAYESLVLEMYWKQRDLSVVIALAQAGLTYMLERANEQAAQDAMKTLVIRNAAMSMSYNLASFCWPGWNEQDIVIGEDEIEVGYQAAVQHQALVDAFQKHAVKRARAIWIVAAFEMTRKQWSRAKQLFESSAALAQEAKSEADRLLALAYAILCEQASQEENADVTQTKLIPIKQQLTSLEHGSMYIDQIDTAAKVHGIMM